MAQNPNASPLPPWYQVLKGAYSGIFHVGQKEDPEAGVNEIMRFFHEGLSGADEAAIACHLSYLQVVGLAHLARQNDQIIELLEELNERGVDFDDPDNDDTDEEEVSDADTLAPETAGSGAAPEQPRRLSRRAEPSWGDVPMGDTPMGNEPEEEVDDEGTWDEDVEDDNAEWGFPLAAGARVPASAHPVAPDAVLLPGEGPAVSEPDDGEEA